MARDISSRFATQIGEGPKFTAFVQASADVPALEATMAEKMALPRFAAQLSAYGDDEVPLNELVIAGARPPG